MKREGEMLKVCSKRNVNMLEVETKKPLFVMEKGLRK